MRFDVSNRSPLTCKENRLLRLLEREYTDPIARDILLPLVTQTSPASLRALDWCVTNWAKRHNVVCSSPAAGKLVNIHHSYRNMLFFWKRRLFDPFRRRSRILVWVDGSSYETTLGQANFALWTYQTGCLSYVTGHIADIEGDMNAVSQAQKRERRDAVARGVRKRRRELTPSPKSLCVAYVAPSRVSFDDEAP